MSALILQLLLHGIMQKMMELNKYIHKCIKDANFGIVSWLLEHE